MFDTAIVGGGPAGCSAAITLAQRGARVVLFEAKTYPHNKLCGEFLSPECAGLLDELGLTSALRTLQPVPIEIFRLTAPDGTEWQTRLPGIALGLTRKALDAALAERALTLGVEVRSGTTVTAIRGSLSQSFELETRSNQVRARTVIAAHGKRGPLDRALHRRFLEHPQPFVALKAHFHGPPLPKRIELHAFPGGYCGMSEVETGATNVCFLAHESVFRGAAENPPERLAEFLKWMPAQNARLQAWLSQATQIDEHWLSIGQVPFAGKRPVEGDILMAGDAAGLIAPLAGDGIAIALQSGKLAAACSSKFLEGRLAADELRRHYAAEWQRAFTARFRLSRILQTIMLRPSLLEPALRLIQAIPAVGNYLVTHTRSNDVLNHE
jgi:menaquinone-9 beta-reductase